MLMLARMLVMFCRWWRYVFYRLPSSSQPNERVYTVEGNDVCVLVGVLR